MWCSSASAGVSEDMALMLMKNSLIANRIARDNVLLSCVILLTSSPSAL